MASGLVVTCLLGGSTWPSDTNFGKRTANAGVGYYINPGGDNLNWWFMGSMLQRKIMDQVAVGTELFHQTVQVRGGKSTTCINQGFIWDLNDLEHVLLSVGHTVQGSSGWQAYLGIQFTFGPKEAKSATLEINPGDLNVKKRGSEFSKRRFAG